VHENQGKRTEIKNENLVRKTNEIQSAIQEENNSPEKTSKFYFLKLSKNKRFVAKPPYNIQICINLIFFLNFSRFA
jgi:hypothetical protein